MTLDAFLAEPPPRALRNTHYVAVALGASLLGLASVLKIDMVVSGTGRLVVDAPTIVLQPMQLSIIRDIRVKPGDAVRRGDVLVTLDPTFAQADRATLSGQRNAFLVRRGRLEAELSGADFDSGNGNPERALERNLFRQRSDQYNARLAEFDGKFGSQQADVAAADLIRQSLEQQLTVARELEAMRATLFRSQNGSKLNYLEAQANRMRAERDLRAGAVALNEARQSLHSLQADRQAFVDGWRRDLLESLVKVRGDLASAEEAVTKAERLNDLVVLTAPADGVVLEVARRSVGSVLHEAEPLITLVPAGAPLIAEVAIGSADVGYARAGDTVAVKVDAFPYQRHGTLAGRLRSVGEDSFASTGGGGQYHRGQVAVQGSALHGLPPGAVLIPGMTVTAEIKVGSRSVISYFLYPITRVLSESIREP